jgi:hypothetical protein
LNTEAYDTEARKAKEIRTVAGREMFKECPFRKTYMCFLQNREGSHKFAASPDDVPVSSSLRYFGENLLRK